MIWSDGLEQDARMRTGTEYQESGFPDSPQASVLWMRMILETAGIRYF